MKIVIFSVLLLLLAACGSAPDSLAEALSRAQNPVSSNADWTTPYPNGLIHTFDDQIPMVLVPAGCFTMGREGDSAAEPLSEICFDSAFWLDQNEVRQADFARLNGVAAEASRFSGENLPVDSITWYEALAFCELRGGSLPTEAQWEYAARGSDNLNYPWGNDFEADNLVYGENSDDVPAAVASRAGGKSWVGAFDLLGNVWEWTSSLFQPYPYDAEDGREDLTTPAARVMRGDSWLGSSLDGFYSASRNRDDPNNNAWNTGFRCARAVNNQ